MNKPKTEYGNFTFKEVAMIAAIIADNIMEKLYAKVQERGEGYMATADLISDWAVEFAEKHTKTSWEKVLEEGMKPLSKGVINVTHTDKKGETTSKEAREIICWDDAVIDFAMHKLETF